MKNMFNWLRNSCLRFLQNGYWRNLFIAIRHLAWHGPVIASRCSILMPASSPLLRIRLSSMKMLSGKTDWKDWLLWQHMIYSDG